MARPIHRLKSIEIDRLAKRRGMHHDGGGLYLSADGKAQCSWLFRYMLDRRARAMGLGPYPTITLAEARDRAAKCRRLVVDGKDPIERRDAEQTRTRLEAAKAITFRQAAKFYMDFQRAGWRNAKHGKLWANTLATYAYPQIGDLPVAAIDTDLIFKVLEPIWTVKPETAGRVRQRIESILDRAKVRGYREGGESGTVARTPRKAPASTVRSAQSSTTLPYTIQNCPPSWPSFGSKEGWPRGHWSSRSSPPPAPARP